MPRRRTYVAAGSCTFRPPTVPLPTSIKNVRGGGGVEKRSTSAARSAWTGPAPTSDAAAPARTAAALDAHLIGSRLSLLGVTLTVRRAGAKILLITVVRGRRRGRRDLRRRRRRRNNQHDRRQRHADHVSGPARLRLSARHRQRLEHDRTRGGPGLQPRRLPGGA